MRDDDFTEEEVTAWEALLKTQRPANLTVIDYDRLLASQFNLVSAIYRTQTLIDVIASNINKHGSATGDEVVEAFNEAHKASADALSYSRVTLRLFLQKMGEEA